MDSILKKLLVIALASLSFSVFSQSFEPSKEQMELLKKLSPEQQEALAKKYKFDLGSLTGDEDESTNPEFMLPRGANGLDQMNPYQQQMMIGQELTNEEDEDELKQFGLELFAGQPTTFAPMKYAPVPDNYILGVGDTLLINLYGKEESELDLMVNNEGKITIPKLDPILVAGLTYAEMKELVASKVEKNLIGIKATVSFGELRSIRVLVVGDVYAPGSYAVSSLSTITHALYAAGGIKEKGSLRNIQLKRGGKVVSNLDLYDLLLSGDNANDTMLRSGDVVFIPSADQLVAVSGDVKRPAIYEVKGENYQQLIEYAGGFTQMAFKENVFVYSFEDGAKLVKNIDFSDNKVSKLNVGSRVDSIIVPVSSEANTSAIQLIGAVQTPGYYQWHKGFTLSELFRGGLSAFQEDADLTYGVVMRGVPNSVSFLQFRPIDLFEGQSDIQLKKGDQVYVFTTEAVDNGLLSQSDYFKGEDLEEMLKENSNLHIEDRFFWDLYMSALEKQPSQYKNPGLPSVYQLDNRSISKLINDFAIYRWNKFSRHYLLWQIYREALRYSATRGQLKLVEVRGNVKFPGTYPMPEGGTIEQLIAAAGGLKALSSDVIKVSRNSNDGEVAQFNVNPDERLSFDLQARDAITIFELPESKEFVTVEIRGEVKFPGNYSVKRGETLPDLIEKAGGFTNYAFLEAAVFTRESLKKKETQNLETLAQDLRKQLAATQLTQKVIGSGTANYSELQQVINDLTQVSAVGRMVIDLERILDKDLTAISLERGDKLYVPSNSNTVSVIGEVYLPTSHSYTDNVSLTNYIDMSGGVKPIGDADNIYIVKANGSVVIPNQGFWFSETRSKLEPGDTIVVPMDSAPVDNLTLWTQATQILYQLGLAAAAIARL